MHHATAGMNAAHHHHHHHHPNIVSHHGLGAHHSHHKSSAVKYIASPFEDMNKESSIKKKRASLNSAGLTKRGSFTSLWEAGRSSVKPFWAISPDSNLAARWTICNVCGVLYNTFSIPLNLAYGDGDSIALYVIERTVDLFFILDLVVNFLTGIHKKGGHIDYSCRNIATNYLRGWFFLDAISAFPWVLLEDVLFSSEGQSRLPQLVKVLKLFRLWRLLRMLKLAKMISALEYSLMVRSTLSTVLKFTVVVVLCSHWLACAFFGAGMAEPEGEEYNWVDAAELRHLPASEQYVASLYWVVMTVTTVGYGDVTPVSMTERVVVIFAMLVGAGVFAYGVSNIVTVVYGSNKKELLFRAKMDEVNEYMSTRDIAQRVRAEVRDYFIDTRATTEANNSLQKESVILESLPTLLRSKVTLDINRNILQRVEVFSEAPPSLVTELGMSMMGAVFPPETLIIREGETDRDVFVIGFGEVEVLKAKRNMVVLGPGSVIGELSALDSVPRQASVRTLTVCETRVINGDDFKLVMSKYPDAYARLRAFTESRREALVRFNMERLKSKLRAAVKTITLTRALRADVAVKTPLPDPISEGDESELMSGDEPSLTEEEMIHSMWATQERLVAQMERMEGMLRGLVVGVGGDLESSTSVGAPGAAAVAGSPSPGTNRMPTPIAAARSLSASSTTATPPAGGGAVAATQAAKQPGQKLQQQQQQQQQQQHRGSLVAPIQEDRGEGEGEGEGEGNEEEEQGGTSAEEKQAFPNREKAEEGDGAGSGAVAMSTRPTIAGGVDSVTLLVGPPRRKSHGEAEDEGGGGGESEGTGTAAPGRPVSRGARESSASAASSAASLVIRGPPASSHTSGGGDGGQSPLFGGSSAGYIPTTRKPDNAAHNRVYAGGEE